MRFCDWIDSLPVWRCCQTTRCRVRCWRRWIRLQAFGLSAMIVALKSLAEAGNENGAALK
jgi:hypothetical protein